MKNINKILLLIAFSAIAFSCSNDDEPAPASSNLEEVSLSLAASSSSKPIEAPSAMASSDNPYAIQATGYVAQVNALTSYLSYFKPAGNAVKSNTRITASNGRVAATQTEYLVYTWTDPQTEFSIAYQVSEQSGKYVFEIFVKTSSKADWLLYVYAEEKTDGSEGMLKAYDSFYGGGALVYTYSWKRTGEVIDFVLFYDLQDMNIKIDISINERTKAGSVNYYLDGEKFYNMTWDAQGNGSWAFYTDGVVDESGTWTV